MQIRFIVRSKSDSFIMNLHLLTNETVTLNIAKKTQVDEKSKEENSNTVLAIVVVVAIVLLILGSYINLIKSYCFNINSKQINSRF